MHNSIRTGSMGTNHTQMTGKSGVIKNGRPKTSEEAEMLEFIQDSVVPSLQGARMSMTYSDNGFLPGGSADLDKKRGSVEFVEKDGTGFKGTYNPETGTAKEIEIQFKEAVVKGEFDENNQVKSAKVDHDYGLQLEFYIAGNDMHYGYKEK